MSKPIEDGTIVAGKYTVLRPEVDGPAGMFICRENAVDEPRSLWLMHPLHGLDPNGERFLAELAKVAKLVHPQLRKVLEFGREQSGLLYVVYETLELRNLTQLLEQDWPLSDERVVWLTCQLLAALEAAHAAGVTHGDLRPENLLIRAAGPVSQNEELVLSGLGLTGAARYAFANRDSRPHLSLTEWMEGTPPFAAPEQLRGEPRDPRSDIYGVGLLLFQLLTRTAPFLAANELDIAWMQCFTPPPAPSGYGQVSTALEAVCLKALTKTPDARYQTANEMRAALLEAQARGSQRVRLSRPPSSPSYRAVVVSTRSSSPSLVPVRVLPSHSSEADRLARTSLESSQPDAEDELPARRVKARKSSASLLIACSALAIVAALVLPDLKLREPDAEMVVQAERGEEATLFDEPAELPPIELPQRKAVVAEAAQAVPVVPESNETRALEAAKPQLEAAKGSASVAATVAAPSPAPAAVPTVTQPRREPGHVRVRTIEKNLVAADSSDATGRTPVAMEVVAAGHPVAPVAAAASPAPTPTPAAADAPAASVALAATAPALASEPQPSAASSEQPQVGAEASVFKPAPAPTTPAPAEPKPQAIVLATTAPKSPAPSPVTGDVTVVIGEAKTSLGAASKAALRAAFNQAALGRCYRDAVERREHSETPMSAELEFSTNSAGRITAARASGATLTPAVTRCIEDAARLGRVREADTGEVRATVNLRFFLR